MAWHFGYLPIEEETPRRFIHFYEAVQAMAVEMHMAADLDIQGEVDLERGILLEKMADELSQADMRDQPFSIDAPDGLTYWIARCP